MDGFKGKVWHPGPPSGWMADHPRLVNNVLYSLCSYIKTRHELNSFTVVLDTKAAAYSPALTQQVFNPLQLLGDVGRLTLEHNGQTTTTLTRWTGVSPLSGVDLVDAGAIFKEADAYVSLVFAERLRRPGVPPRGRLNIGFSTLDDQEQKRLTAEICKCDEPESVMRWLPRCEVICNSQWEGNMDRCITGLQNALDRVDTVELDRWACAVPGVVSVSVAKSPRYSLGCRAVRKGEADGV